MAPTPPSVIIAQLRAAGCVFAEEEAQLLSSAAQSPAELAEMVERRVAGVPVEYIIGWAEFCGLRIQVHAGVFVPRRRTEFLVTQAARATTSVAGQVAVVVDLCCGSGAVGAALVAALPEVELYAVDIDPAAVRCARRNVAGRVYEGDLYEPLPPDLRGRVDLVIANAPYVPSDEIALLPAEARSHEARVALDGGPDGLDIQRRVIAGAASWLAPSGALLIETSERQSSATAAAFSRAGLTPLVARDDELNATVVIGELSRAEVRRAGRR